jgi:hypothetical protein
MPTSDRPMPLSDNDLAQPSDNIIKEVLGTLNKKLEALSMSTKRGVEYAKENFSLNRQRSDREEDTFSDRSNSKLRDKFGQAVDSTAQSTKTEAGEVLSGASEFAAAAASSVFDMFGNGNGKEDDRDNDEPAIVRMDEDSNNSTVMAIERLHEDSQEPVFAIERMEENSNDNNMLLIESLEGIETGIAKVNKTLVGNEKTSSSELESNRESKRKVQPSKPKGKGRGVGAAVGGMFGGKFAAIAGAMGAAFTTFITGSVATLFSGITSALGLLFKPGMLLKVISKVFIPAAIIASIVSGVMDGFKEFQASGSITNAIIKGLTGILDFITFGIIDGEEIGNFIIGIKDAVFASIKAFIGDATSAIKKAFSTLSFFDSDEEEDIEEASAGGNRKKSRQQKRVGPNKPAIEKTSAVLESMPPAVEKTSAVLESMSPAVEKTSAVLESMPKEPVSDLIPSSKKIMGGDVKSVELDNTSLADQYKQLTGNTLKKHVFAFPVEDGIAVLDEPNNEPSSGVSMTGNNYGQTMSSVMGGAANARDNLTKPKINEGGGVGESGSSKQTVSSSSVVNYFYDSNIDSTVRKVQDRAAGSMTGL